MNGPRGDIVTIAENEATEYQGILHVDVTSVHSESTIAYDINSDMIIDYDIDFDSESVQSANVEPDLPDINQVRAELNLLGGSDRPPADSIMPLSSNPCIFSYLPKL